MPHPRYNLVLESVRRLIGRSADEAGNDGQLLEQFALHNEEAAFATLMRRHGPMVLGVCRRVLRHEQDVEDVFQATFLLLVRKAGAIRRRESVGSWLHGVAYRLSCHARVDAARRHAREGQAQGPLAPEQPGFAAAWHELQAVLDEELHRLPEKYRAPLVLCYLEGKTHGEAAQELAWPPGTVKGRLARARELLRDRLARRGLALSAAPFAAMLAVNAASADLPATLASTTIQVALGAGVPAPVASLVDGLARAVFLTRLKVVAATLLVAGAIATGAGLFNSHTRTGQPSDDSQAGAPPAPVQPLTLPVPVDRYGDGLPEDVLTRLGTPRLSTGNTLISFVFSPDGKTVAAGGDREVFVWDAATGAELHRLKGHQGRVFGVAMAPDGKTLASAGLDRTIHLWDLASGQELRQLQGHQSKVFSLMFSPDGQTLVSCGMDGTLRLWEVESGKQNRLLRAPASGNGPSVACPIRFLPDNRTFATQDQHDTILLWDTLTGEARRPFDRLPTPHTATALAPDGKLLATASAGQTEVRLWDVKSGREVRQLKGHDRAIAALSFSADSSRLISASEDRTVRLWDTATGEEVSRLLTDQEQFFGLSLSADGRTLAAGCDTAVRLWSLAAGRPLHPFVSHRGQVGMVAFTPDGNKLVTVSLDGTARLWDSAGGAQKEMLDLPPQQDVLAAALSPDGRTLACGSRDRTIHLYDLATGEELRQWPAHEKAISSLAFAPDGRTLLSGSWDRTVALWDVDSETPPRRWGDGWQQVESVAISFDQRFAVGHRDGTVRICQGVPGATEHEIQVGTDPVHSVAFSPDGRTLACASGRKGSPGQLSLWEVATGQKRGQLLGHEDRPTRVVFSPDGKLLASAGADEKVRLWTLASGKEITALGGHRGAVVSLAFSPDGTLLASGGMDTTVLVRRVAKD